MAGTSQPTGQPSLTKITIAPSFGKAFGSLATQLSPQGSQAEQTETEQRHCRTAIGHLAPEVKCHVDKISGPPPFVQAGRHAQAGESRVVKGHAIR